MDLSKVFHITISKDKMRAEIQFIKDELISLSEAEINQLKEEISFEHVVGFAHSQGVKYGILEDEISSFIEEFRINQDPAIFAVGEKPLNGEDGKLDYHVRLGTTMEIEDSQTIDFKEIMVIPKVETGTKLVTLISPTPHQDGMGVTGEILKGKPGKPALLKAGQNTEYQEDQQAIFATSSGQVSLTTNKIQVLPVYEVNDSLSLETGNIDFNGSIVINGDIPTGFSLKARGDITIKGVVEAANLEAGGSIFIHSGISSVGKGEIRAGLDIRVINVNQGNLVAGRNIIIENSCLHSQVDAKEILHCHRGHIIGGNISVGKKIEGNDFGSRMSTKTNIFLGQSKQGVEAETNLEILIEETQDQIQKLKTLGEKLESIKKIRELSSKERIMLLRQKNSLELSEAELKEAKKQYDSFIENKDTSEYLKIDVNGILYPNVHIAVKKYTMTVKQEYKHVSVVYKNQDFSIIPL